MKKLTRKEKKTEEARVLAQMRAALDEAERAEQGIDETKNEAQTAPQTPPQNAPQNAPKQEMTYHCRKCKTMMQNGVCPTCGFKMYVPIDEKKLGKIKVVLTAVAMAVFVVLFVYLQLIKG